MREFERHEIVSELAPPPPPNRELLCKAAHVLRMHNTADLGHALLVKGACVGLGGSDFMGFSAVLGPPKRGESKRLHHPRHLGVSGQESNGSIAMPHVKLRQTSQQWPMCFVRVWSLGPLHVPWGRKGIGLYDPNPVSKCTLEMALELR